MTILTFLHMVRIKLYEWYDFTSFVDYFHLEQNVDWFIIAVQCRMKYYMILRNGSLKIYITVECKKSTAYSECESNLSMMTSSTGNIFRVTVPLWGNISVTAGFSSQKPATRSLLFSLVCAWTNSSANNQDAGDLTCLRVQYDINFMKRNHLGFTLWAIKRLVGWKSGRSKMPNLN